MEEKTRGKPNSGGALSGIITGREKRNRRSFK